MLLRRFFERARTRSSSDTNKRENSFHLYNSFFIRYTFSLSFSLVYLETCLCTTAKRDSLYDDPGVSLAKTNERQSVEQYGFVRSGKYLSLIEKIFYQSIDLLVCLFR
jgi:hypothetical protein